MKILLLLSGIFFFVACSSSHKTSSSKTTVPVPRKIVLTEISTDPTYGYSSDNAVKVGGVDKHAGPLNERNYLNALAGPNGETISYYRAGSCCPVESENGFMGVAMMDDYRVTWEGSIDTVSIFINMYDNAPLKAPKGFTIRK